MNLTQLYEQTPVERHKDIKLVGDKVLVRDVDGDTDEYLIVREGEEEQLWLVRSDKKLRLDVEAIRKKVGA